MDGHKANTELVAEMYDPNTKESLGKILIRKEEKDLQVSKYADKENRNLRVCLIGTLLYKHVFDRQEMVYQYLVLRTINGEDQVNTVYSTLSLLNLKPKSERTDFIINNLLSEETIDGSELNYGYIGGIQKDKNGKWTLEIENASSFFDDDSFAAVVVWKQGLSAYEIFEKIRKQNEKKNEPNAQDSVNSSNCGTQGDEER